MTDDPTPEWIDDFADSELAEPAMDSVPTRRFCGACGSILLLDMVVCTTCEARSQAKAAVKPHTVELGEIKSALFLYFALLAVSIIHLIVLLATDDEHVTTGEIVAQIAMSVIVVVWSVAKFSTIRPVLMSRAAIGWYPLAGILAVGTFFLATGCLYLLNMLGGIETVEYLDEFGQGTNGFLWAVLWICVQPAVFEELAFRGVIQGTLAQVVSPWQAVMVSAGMFTVLHLSAPSAPHLLTLGIVLGWLRLKSGSIYPGMLLHFTHNFLCIATERMGILNP